MNKLILCSMLVAATDLCSAASMDELRTTLDDQKAVAVTIYNDNLALVKDQRSVKVPSGSYALAFRDVSAQMKPESAILTSLTASGSLSVFEQNFNFDLLTPEKLLEKYVGKDVTIVRTHPQNGSETQETARVLSANHGVVLKIGNRIETGIPGRIVFPDVPGNLRDRPTLVMMVNNKASSDQLVELSYLTGGLSWRADYVVELSGKEDKIDLSGWVTLVNTSGTRFQNARLQLVAGDVQKFQERQPQVRYEMMKAAPVAMDMRAVSQESLFEYHLYTLARPTNLEENQTKQVALLNAAKIPARKELVVRGSDYYYMNSASDLGQKIKAAAYLEFENKESAGLGIPLPKGVMRVYKRDSQGNAQFIGENGIDHTAKNERVRIKLGDAFDVTTNKKQTDFKRISSEGKNPQVFESAYEFEVRNAKSESVEVLLQEPIPGDWKITQSSHKWEKVSSNLVNWKITIPAEGSVKVTYRAQVK